MDELLKSALVFHVVICLPRIDLEPDAGPDISNMTADSGYHLIRITGNRGQDGGEVEEREVSTLPQKLIN